MFTAIILMILVAAIVVASRRWQEIETKLFGHSKPPSKRAETTQRPSASSEGATPPVTKATEKPAEPIAGGVMHRRELSTEPDVDPSVMKSSQTQTAVQSEATPVAAAPEEPVAAQSEDSASVNAGSEPKESEDEPEVGPPPIDEEPAKTEAADQAPPREAHPEATPEMPQEAASDTPGKHVTGDPAVPSEPAYVDATHGLSDDFDELSRIADQAYRDREYEKAEQACLKILMQQPKNHKYMTRIGQIYQEMGNLEDAKEAFEAAKSLDPKNFFVLNRLTEVERQLADKGGKKVTKKK